MRKTQCNLPIVMNKLHRLPLICLTVLSVTACALLPQPDVYPPTDTTPSMTIERPPGGVRYELEQAQLIIHTYRGGWLKSKAHNHVMITEPGGHIYLTDPIEYSTAVLYFRPWDLVLDEPDARAAAGPGFESDRTPADIAATRTRMLGPNGFDSNAYPFVIAEVRWLDRSTAAVDITLKGAQHPTEVPVAWTMDEDRIHVEADFQLSHRALGLKPYAVFAGAIGVADPIRIQLTLSARKTG